MLKYIYDLNNKKPKINYDLLPKYKKIIDLNNEQIKIGKHRTCNIINNFAVKSFNDKKELYTTKVPQFCGTIIKENGKMIYEYDNKKVDINPLFQDEKMIITDLIIIKNVIRLSSKQTTKIIISNLNILIDDNLTIGFIVNKDNNISIYIERCKIMNFLDLLNYKNLGVNLINSYKNSHPSYEQRIFMSIDLIRQVKELIDLSIYDDTILKSHNLNYYGIAVTINDLLQFDYLTSLNSFSPEYYIINTLLQNKRPNVIKLIKDLEKLFPNIYKNLNVKEMKELLDNSLHRIIGEMIINILSWKDVQYPIWYKHYNPQKYKIGYHSSNYTSYDTAFNYAREMLCELFKNKFLYEDIFYFSSSDIDLLIDLINKFSKYDTIKNIIDDRFKKKLIDFILIIYNLFEFSPDKKMSLSDMYDKLKDYPGYQTYLALKPAFL
jgi:hypothetical protein